MLDYRIDFGSDLVYSTKQPDKKMDHQKIDLAERRLLKRFLERRALGLRHGIF